MAKIQIKMPDEIMEKISKLENRTDETVFKMLEAGGNVVLKAVRSKLKAVIGKGVKYKSRSTGELEKSLGISPPRIDSKGNYDIKIGFAEPRSNGGSNAMIASVIEHGKHGQPAKPFMAPAKRESKKACIEAMEKTFNEEVEKL